MELTRYVVKNLKTNQYVTSVYSNNPEPRIYRRRSDATMSIPNVRRRDEEIEDFEIIPITITVPDL